MALETGIYINSLVSTNPTGSDAKSAGDDHLRLIKSTLKNTFPNIDAAITADEDELNLMDGVTATTAEINLLDGVTATTTELNYTDGVTSNIQTQLTALDTKQTIIDAIYPVGSLYTTTISTSPAAALGGTWIAFGKGQVLVGKADSGTFSSAGNTGGAETDSHQLSISEMPSHTHGVTHTTTSPKVTGSFDGTDTHSNLNASASTETTTPTGDGNTHTHDIVQPYIVVYIWKRTVL